MVLGQSIERQSIERKSIERQSIVKTDLKLSPLKMQTCQHLKELQKEKRLTRAKILLNKLKDGTDTSEVIFSEEKLLTVEAVCNRQNDRILAK